VILLENNLNEKELKSMFTYVAQEIIDNEGYLTAIDKKVRDGDHGTGMSLGFKRYEVPSDEGTFSLPSIQGEFKKSCL
jgi:hypothetical protein